MPRPAPPRTICYVTGTRAEFGLMANTLRAIQAHPGLRLQIVATGMHLDPAHGNTLAQIRREGFPVEATVPWKPAGDDLAQLAAQTGLATAKLAAAFAKLDPDVVLVTGDRVEAFAAATAAHLSGKVLAHVHGGDRALGQVDDTLRHTITKLAHVHFPATKQSAERIAKLGEDKWRIHCVGSPGIDGIREAASPWHEVTDTFKHLVKKRYALLVLHPTSADDDVERQRAVALFEEVANCGVDHTVIVYPNNDPGSAGIVRAWDAIDGLRLISEVNNHVRLARNLPRSAFLGLLRDAAVLVGNSSSGIIEAASFGTPVLDVGPRQAGRERGRNVTSIPFKPAAIRKALKAVWNSGRPRRYAAHNPYGAGDTAARIAATLAAVPITDALRRKLISY